MSVYQHRVKHNGVWYEPGTDVPDDTTPEKIVEPLKEDNVAEPTTENTKDFPYNRTEVNRLSTSDLQKIGAEYGIENAYETSGSQLKKMLIEKYGL
jgi:hypothetical protein